MKPYQALVSLFMCLWLLSACATKVIETAIAPDEPTHSMIIASDASEFKDKIRSRIIDTYKDAVSISVINIGDLSENDVSGVDVILIMDTCMAWTGFNPSLKSFMKLPENRNKTVLFMTAGDPEWTYSYEEVDAITSASFLENEQSVYLRIKSEIDRLLSS